jgi:tRNA-dihydrouridine synthase
MFDEVGCDAVMIGRAALGNPWTIRRTKHYLETGELIAEPTPREKIETAILHYDRLIDLKGEKVASLEFRQHAAYYLKGISRAAKVKAAINQSENRATTVHLLEEFLEKVENQPVKS